MISISVYFQTVLIASVFVASAMAMPAGPPAYAPAPHHGGYKIPPRPFAYAYGVSDEYSGTNFDKKETQVILISYFLSGCGNTKFYVIF